jgi:hypothetical protein
MNIVRGLGEGWIREDKGGGGLRGDQGRRLAPGASPTREGTQAKRRLNGDASHQHIRM